MSFTWEQLTAAVVVVGAIITAYNLMSTALKNHREQKKLKDAPIEDINKRLATHDEMLNRDKRRLDAIELQNDSMQNGINVLMRSSLAMTRHMKHGNNIAGLDDSEKEIINFLSHKPKGGIE